MSSNTSQGLTELSAELLQLARAGKFDELKLHDLTPTVTSLLNRAVVVEKDRASLIGLIARKNQAVNDAHGALLLALQGMARNR